MQYREQNTHRADARKYLEAKSKGKFDIWKEAAETGIPSGQALLGLCYFDGISVPQDKTVAMEWLCKAAIQGCTIPAYPFMEMENENFHEHQ
jgi:TPR repeat protein